MEQTRNELQKSLQETGRLSSVSDKLGRAEIELKNQIEDKEKTICQVTVIFEGNSLNFFPL